MGEKIEELGKLSIGEEEFMVDANLGLPGPGRRDIHIQNEKFRFQMYEVDFVNFLARVISAQKKVERAKRGNQ